MSIAPIHKWTANEIRMATDLRRAGKSHAEISNLLGRPIGAVRGYLNRHHIGPDRTARHRTMQRAAAKRNRDYSAPCRPADFIGHITRVDMLAQLLADRDRRANELRAAGGMQGEPPYSQSAIARVPVPRPP